MSPEAQATRSVLKEYAQEALEGTLTIEDVLYMVRQVLPTAQRARVLDAIGAYGPIGEGDVAWERRARQPQIPSWFYSARNGKERE